MARMELERALRTRQPGGGRCASTRRRRSGSATFAGSERRSPRARSRSSTACRWGIKESTWLPEGAWAACEGEVEFTDGERVWIGVDVGGRRSATGVCWMNAKLHVGIAIFEGEDAVFEAQEVILQLAERYEIAAINFDPWRAAVMVKAFENRGLNCTIWPWSDARVIPAASQLYDAIVERQDHAPRRRRPRPAHVARDRAGDPEGNQDRQGEPVGSDRRRRLRC